jgi:hypothetical protein
MYRSLACRRVSLQQSRLRGVLFGMKASSSRFSFAFEKPGTNSGARWGSTVTRWNPQGSAECSGTAKHFRRMETTVDPVTAFIIALAFAIVCLFAFSAGVEESQTDDGSPKMVPGSQRRSPTAVSSGSSSLRRNADRAGSGRTTGCAGTPARDYLLPRSRFADTRMPCPCSPPTPTLPR